MNMKNIIKTFVGFVFVDILQTVVVALAIFVVVYIFIASPNIIVGSSMYKSFHDGEFLLTNKLQYHFQTPQRGDVIIFKFDPTHDYIKRVIGLPGDTIMLNEGSVYLNGKKLDESAYITPGNLTYGLDFLQNNKTIQVPAHQYFVLGDNREESSDSRQWGFVDQSAIEGKAWLVYWPLNSVEVAPTIKYTSVGNDIVASKN
jgi:signal peptidase I